MTENRMPDAAPEEPSPPGEGEPRGSRGALWAWIALAVLLALAFVQVAGVLLRDRLERRRPALAAAPAAAPSAAGREPAPEATPSRFGPEVVEVEVGAPAGSPAAAGPPTPIVPAAPPAPPTQTPAPTPAPAPPPAPARPTRPVARDAAPPAPAPSRSATHALLVDVFLSQRYLQETEGRLKTLGVSSFRVEITRPGRGFRVAAPGADRSRARKALEAAGYACRDGRGGVEAYFYYRDEAAAAAAALARAGLEASTEETRGERPFWKLYAGPFPEAEAREARGRLEARGLKTTLERRP